MGSQVLPMFSLISMILIIMLTLNSCSTNLNKISNTIDPNDYTVGVEKLIDQGFKISNIKPDGFYMQKKDISLVICDSDLANVEGGCIGVCIGKGKNCKVTQTCISPDCTCKFSEECVESKSSCSPP